MLIIKKLIFCEKVFLDVWYKFYLNTGCKVIVIFCALTMSL